MNGTAFGENMKLCKAKSLDKISYAVTIMCGKHGGNNVS